MTAADRYTLAATTFLGLSVAALGALHFINWLDYHARPKLYRGAK